VKENMRKTRTGMIDELMEGTYEKKKAKTDEEERQR